MKRLLALIFLLPTIAYGQGRVTISGTGDPSGYCFNSRYEDVSTGNRWLCNNATHTWQLVDTVARWRSGSGVPANSLGKDLDFYRDTATGILYQRQSGAYAALNVPVAAIQGLAAVASSGAYSDLSGKPTLATVATSGSYSDLSGKPSIPAAQVQSDWNAVSGLGQILNKPTLGTAAAQNISAFESPLTFNSPLLRSVNSISCQVATGSLAGCLSASDWTNFNGKQAALGFTPEQQLTFTAPLNRSTNTVSVVAATTSVPGSMSAADKAKLDGLPSSVSYPVSSVFTRTGAVTAQSGDYTTSQVTESVDKRYVTDAQRTVIQNTSNTNTGDENSASIVSKLAGSSPSVATVTTSGFIINTPQIVSIPDNGTGAVVNFTLTPSASNIEVTCLDTSGGCNVTLSESTAVRGMRLNIMNAGTISFMITDQTGVQETSANFSVGSFDVITFVYISDRFLEVSRSNN